MWRNSVELIVAIAALFRGGDANVTIVQTSLVGSIISNLLLVLGMSFWCGALGGRARVKKLQTMWRDVRNVEWSKNGPYVPTVWRDPLDPGRNRDPPVPPTDRDFELKDNGDLIFVETETVLNEDGKPIIEEHEVGQLRTRSRARKEWTWHDFTKQWRMHEEWQAARTQRTNQTFNADAAGTQGSLLVLAVCSTILPTAFQLLSKDKLDPNTISSISRGLAIVSLIGYGCYLAFILKTHEEVYRGGKEEDPVDLSLASTMAVLSLSTLLTLGTSWFMVDGLEKSPLEKPGSIFTLPFIGLIILPIAGNVVEHWSAISAARENKADMVISISVGSAIQVAILIFPLLVVIDWVAGKDNMTMSIEGFQAVFVFLAALLANNTIVDGASHWFEGIMLTLLYMSVTALSFVLLFCLLT